ncbi:hypothetical protein EJ913_00815 [Azospirillum doebereinerae]|uniref:Uncharacterized protein n=1 Tax=Azospirillum doebereinerae TaxID=92933 RepID=A0A3S0XQW6_9PROT|nr:hypothetical protein EJ913_00815 [Azospirillum doebereinerae]
MSGDSLRGFPPLPPGERGGVRGIRFVAGFGCADPPHPGLLPGGEKERGAGLINAHANAHARRHGHARHRRHPPA